MKKGIGLVCFFVVAIVMLSWSHKPVKIFLVGDSTMADKSSINDNPERGWGMVLPSYFNDEVLIENHARNGRSSRTFIEEGRWAFVLDRIHEGDYVVIQFGHNDEVETKKSFTTQADFKANFERFVRDVREHKANPILCTSVARRAFDSATGKLTDTHPIYPCIIRQVAKEMDVPLIDMQQKSEAVLKSYGMERSKSLFMNIEPGIWKAIPKGRIDNTHFVETGAMEMAKCFVEGIKELNIKELKNKLLKDAEVKLKLTTEVPGIEKVKPKL